MKNHDDGRLDAKQWKMGKKRKNADLKHFGEESSADFFTVEIVEPVQIGHGVTQGLTRGYRTGSTPSASSSGASATSATGSPSSAFTI